MILIRDMTADTTHRESLVSFAGTVAHDLNNPLSVIDGWAEALEEDLADSDETDALAAAPMVQHIRAGVEQMRGFIADLLAHAVARDQSLSCEPVVAAQHGQAHRRHPRPPATAVARSSPVSCSTSGPTGCSCARCSTT